MLIRLQEKVKLPVPPQAQIQPATKLKSTVYTNENQTKDNKQPHILQTSTLDKKAYKPENFVDIPNLETSIVDLCQSFGKLNLETLLKQILESQRSMSAEVSSLDNKLEKINKEHIDYRESANKVTTLPNGDLLISSLSNIEKFFKVGTT